jgi:galactose mutarotase-like enzyme
MYRLRGNELDVIWEVTNPSTESDLHFQIGAHPGFYYPDYDPKTSGRGSFVFDAKDSLECAVVGEKGCVRPLEKFPLQLDNDVLKVEVDTFDEPKTLVFEDSQVKKVDMLKEDGTPWVSMTFDAPVLALWSPPCENAPFVCIEPWYGRCDRMNYEGEFKDRDWMNTVAPGAIFSTSYTIVIA